MPAVRVARHGFQGEYPRAESTAHADKESKVTEDLVRYMKSASENNNTFLTDDPIWAEDFAPNGGLTNPAVKSEHVC
jgi:gamma-glutamyltranspeptidase/glutathione hydrolase